MRACGELHRAAIVAGLCSCSRVRGSSSGSSGSSGSNGSWNLSLECLQGRNLAECSFGLEIRNPRSNSFASSRRRGNLRDVPAPTFTINGTGRISKKDDGQYFKDVHLLKKIREFQSLALQGVAQWKIVPASRSLPKNFFLGVLALVVLVGMLKLREFVSFGRKSPESGVKSRILRSQWFKDSRSRNGKRKLDEALIRPSKTFKAEEADLPVFERLVLHDGEVIRGGSNNSKREPSSRRKISLGPNNSAQGVKSSTLAETNRLSRVRNFLSRANHNARPLFQNARTTPAEEAIKEQVGETRLQRNWNDKDELDLRKRVDDLRQSVQAAESNRKAAIQALVQERKRSLELEVKIRRQKEAASALEEEVRVLKESHEALLVSLRKKYSSSAAARAAAALLYQNWESGETSNV